MLKSVLVAQGVATIYPIEIALAAMEMVLSK